MQNKCIVHGRCRWVTPIIENKPLHLASSSPRRREILAALDLDFTVGNADVDEQQLDGETAGDMVLRLARDKARAGAPGDEFIVIGADTAVVLGGTIFGKPRDQDNALEMLAQLSGQTHQVMTGVAVIFGYALLGGTWLVMKTEGETQLWARKCASYVIGYVAVFLAIVSISMPIMNADIRTLWFSMPNFFFLLPIPTASLVLLIIIWRDLHAGREFRPFLLSFGVFLMGYLGIAISTWPYIVPFEITFRQAAAAPESQSLLLVGTVVMLPLILAYVGFCYYIFRGKASHESAY